MFISGIAMNFPIQNPDCYGGMNPRIRRLRQESVETPATLTIERALIETAFYKENYGKYPVPILRARNFYEICATKALKSGIRLRSPYGASMISLRMREAMRRCSI